MNTNSKKTAIGINLGSPKGIPTTPTNTIEVRAISTKHSGFINRIHHVSLI
jgi:hypothetical protein